MTGSLRALLAGAIDYAGLFPPASLSLAEALAKYRDHRDGPAAWMLGRFVCSTAKLAELASMWQRDRDGSLAVVVSLGGTDESEFAKLITALSSMGRFPDAHAIDTLEFRWQPIVVEESATRSLAKLSEIAAERVASATARLTAAKLPVAATFFELPPASCFGPGSAWPIFVEHFARRLATQNQNAGAQKPPPAGLKLRCGGMAEGAVPTSAETARLICACRDAGVFWKATAGLHLPFAGDESAPGMPDYGFLNLFAASVMADVHHLDATRVQAIIDDDDPLHFCFGDEALTWHEHSAGVQQIATARGGLLRSFGSCSIDEPWHELESLGLFP